MDVAFVELVGGKDSILVQLEKARVIKKKEHREEHTSPLNLNLDQKEESLALFKKYQVLHKEKKERVISSKNHWKDILHQYNELQEIDTVCRDLKGKNFVLYRLTMDDIHEGLCMDKFVFSRASSVSSARTSLKRPSASLRVR